MATKFYGATAINGGASGAMDSIKFATLQDGDICLITDSSEDYAVFRFESSSSTAESSPWQTNKVVEPDDVGASNGRWVLTDQIFDEVTTYGNVTVNGNLDVTGTFTFDGAGVAISSILDEDTLVSDSATALATQQSIKAYVDNAVATASPDSLAGFLSRTKFTYVDADTITLQSARYHHNGTAEQITKWDSALTYNFGSGGSNAGSENLGASEIHYLYIDDSELSGSTITAARLINNTTAPTFSATELGWYNGNDKCIGAFLTDGSSNLLEFIHTNDIFWYANHIQELTDGSNTAFTDVDMTSSVPRFATKIKLFAISSSGNGQTGEAYWRTNGQTSSTGHFIGTHARSNNRLSYIDNQFDVVSDSLQVIEYQIIYTVGSDIDLDLYVDGWYFPEGM